MGNGFVQRSKINFIVTSDFALTNTQKTDWQAYFQRASDVMHGATGGQLAFGKVWLMKTASPNDSCMTGK